MTNSSVKNIEVYNKQAGQRLDNFLLNFLKPAPKSLIYKIIRTGQVRVNSKRCKPLYKIKTGDMVRIPPVRMTDTATKKAPSAMVDLIKKSIIFEDDDILVLNKPANISVHGGSNIKWGIIEAIKSGINNDYELIHRLDKKTTGVLLIAKNYHFLKKIQTLIKSRKIEKIYYARVAGLWDKKIIKIDKAMDKKNLRNGEKFMQINPKGKQAITHILNCQYINNNTSLLKIRIETGRTHQIRLHLSHFKHPIIGDDKYNKNFENEQKNNLYLHSSQIIISKKYNFVADLPQHFKF